MQDSDQDYHNFSTPSSHRLPTVSGTQAIRNAIRNSKPIPTGLASLDSVLGSAGRNQPAQHGLRRGTVTEVFGPPGVGKTTFALQAAINIIYHEKAQVTWIDTSAPLTPSRFTQLLDSFMSSEISSKSDSLEDARYANVVERFSHFEITSLPKLLSMFLHPLAGFPPTETSLVVLDDLSNLLLSSLPRIPRKTAPQTSQVTPSQVRTDYASKQTMSRRAQVISSLASSLQAFAATHNVAVLVTCKARINLKAGQQAFLRSALASQQWDTCLGVRIVLYRDFWPSNIPRSTSDEPEHDQPTDFELWSLRYAQVLKLAGRDVSTSEVGFVIEQHGLREVISLLASDRQSQSLHTSHNLLATDDVLEMEVQHDNDVLEEEQIEILPGPEPYPANNAQGQPGKRKAIEIADSDDEDEAQRASDTAEICSSSPLVRETEVKLPTRGNSSQGLSMPIFQTAKKLRLEENISDSVPAMEKMVVQETVNGVDADEMLLDQVEAGTQIPPFSQAAAEMSDPLTPSDDGRQSP